MKILLAWELGAHFGHLARHLPIAEALKEGGHDPVFAVADTRIAEQLLTPRGFGFLQAPVAREKLRLPAPPANYGELLLAEGFHDPAALAGRVRAWLGLFDLVQPDRLLLDHAPTALLAARIAGCPATVFGTGFEIPPACTPYPCFRPWDAVPTAWLAQSDARALAHIHAVCALHGKPRLSALPELFAGAAQALVTFPELDHYGERPGGRYLGPLFAAAGGRKVSWPSGEGRRVLAYLRADVPGFPEMVEALAARADPTLLIAPDAPASWVARHTSAHLVIHTSPVDFGLLLDECDLGVSYGGSGTLSQFLLAGVPQILMPKNAEQYLGAKRIEEAEAGLLIGQDRSVAHITQTITRVLSDSRYRQTAALVARRYADYRPETTARAVAALLSRPSA